ncbi:MAG TPA: type II toxin-antitoxin system VapC family toxin [Fimbriimonadaceae bacterium]|nr:type II toxin-antitoxin system VapC family toxin [Fimbriimonadaceae bacterium]
MNLLLDTHALIWTVAEPTKLKKQWLAAIVDPSNSVWVSAISIWEISIKLRLGKISLPRNWLEEATTRGYQLLAFEPRHAKAVEYLPLHHRDPFDHALLAQAQTEKFFLVTSDASLHAYAAEVQILA